MKFNIIHSLERRACRMLGALHITVCDYTKAAKADIAYFE